MQKPGRIPVFRVCPNCPRKLASECHPSGGWDPPPNRRAGM